MKTIIDHHYKVLACVFLLALPALFFSTKIRLGGSTEIFFVDGDPAKEVSVIQDAHFQDSGLCCFKQESFIRQNNSFLEEAALPLTNIKLITDAEENDLKNAKVLYDIYDFGVGMEKINGVRWAYPVASLLAELHGLKSRAFRPPPPDFLIGVYLQTLLEEKQEVLRSFANPFFSKARITSGLPTIDYEELLACFFLLFKGLRPGMPAAIPNFFPVFCALSLMFMVGLHFGVLSSFSFSAALAGNPLMPPALLFCFRQGEKVKGERLEAEG